VAGSDQHGIGATEHVDVYAQITGTYYIIVDAADPDSGGTYDLEFSYIWFDPPFGACCYPDGRCEFIMSWDCEYYGGIAYPCQPCDPGLWQPVPAAATTWGRVKRRYR